jgi:PAS domain S-box-containing protein
MVVKAEKPLIEKIELLRKEIEALRGSEEKYKAFVAASQDAIVEVDEKGRIILWNKGAEQIFGYSAEEILGQPVAKLMAEKHRERHRKGFESFLNGDRKVKSFVEGKGLRKDGSTFPIEWSLSSWQENGETIVMASGRDVSERKRAEEALRESQERYSRLYESISEAVALFSLPDLRISHWNKRYEDLHKLLNVKDIKDITISDMASVLEADDLDRAMETLGKVLAGEPLPEIYEIRMKDLEGKRRVFEVKPALYKEKGQVVGIQVAMTDITERKQAEEALRESEERYRHLCGSINEAVALFRFPDFEIIYWNRRFEEYAKQVFAKNVEDITMSDIVASFEADEWNRAMEELDRVLASEPRPEIQEFRIKDAEGKKRIIEVKPALYKEKGQVVGIQVAITDITERKQAEEARREAERRYRAIFDNRLQIVFIHDEQGRLLEANDVALEKFGYTRDDFGKVLFQDIIHPDDLETAFQAVAEIRTKGYYIGHPIQIRIFTKSGEMLWAECVDVALEQEGEHFLYIGIARDITEQKRTEQVLKESEEKYKTLFDSTLDGMAVIDAETLKIVLANQAALKLYGFNSVEEGLGANILDFIPSEDRERVLNVIAKDMFEEDLRQTNELRTITKDGKEKWISALGTKIQHQGKLAGLVSIRDITEQKQAQEALRESQERYSRLYEGINEAVALFELPDLRISHWNRRYEDLHKQMIATDIESTTISDLAPAIEADDRDMVMEGIAKVLAGGPMPDIRVYEIRMSDLEGKRRVIEVKPSFYEEKGQIAGVQVAMADITERKRAEEVLRESEERYSQLYKGINEAVAVCRLPDLKYSYWNKRFEEYAKQVYGKDVEDISASDMPPAVEADDWNMAMEALAKTLAGEPVPKVYELRIKDVEGNRRVIEAKPSFYKEKGQVVGIQVMIADITERKQAEEALRQSEERYRALFDSTVVGTFVIDAETMKIVLGNQAAAKMFGFNSVEEALGVNVLDFIPPDDRERALKIIAKDMFEEDLRQTNEFRTVTKDGKEKWISAVGTRIQHQGKLAGLVSIRDITEQKQAEEALRESQERYSRLYEDINEAVALFSFPDLRISHWNKRFEDIRKQLIAKDTESITISDMAAVIEADDWDKAKEETAKVLGGEPMPDVDVREFRMNDLEGKRRIFEVKSSFYKEKDRVVGIQVAMTDITERKNAEERLKGSFIDLAETISRALESRDPYTAGHQRNVAKLAHLVGEKMGLDEDRLQGLYIGGLLHDIGKISIPASILTKLGKLTEEEWALIRAHPKQGYTILKDSKLPWPVIEMALHHHERLDGSGYPDGISGDELSLEVRILAVCDVVEAMSSHRPYRPARTVKEVLEEINNGRGTKYDASVVDVVVQIIESGKFNFG